MDPIQGAWSPEEDEMLENLIEKHSHNWIRISKSIPGRSDHSCELRWWFLYRPFTSEEDEMLENLFEKHGSNWSLISKFISGRSGQSCKLRWLWSFTPGEDDMLLKLIDKHGRNWSLISESIPGRSVMSCELRWLSLQGSFTPEEDEMLLKLVDKHGRNWSLVSKSIPGTSAKSCESRWLFFRSSLFRPEEDQTNEDTTISDHNIFIQPPYVSDIKSGQRNAYIHDLNLSLALGGVIDQAPSIGEMARDNVSQPSGGFYGMPTLKSLFPLSGHERPQKVYTTATSETLWNLNTKGTQGNSRFHLAMETGSQNSIHERNSSHEVGVVVSGHAPSISDMARGNMSSGGTHSYSRDHSAPSWNALYKRDSSPMMIDSDSVQQFVGSEFGWNDFSEVSSKA